MNAGPASHLDLSYDAANRLTRSREEITGAETTMGYDGRNFLTQARQDLNACSAIVTQATYDSGGTLLGRRQLNLFTNTTLRDAQVFYFAGRPVAIRETAGSTTVKYVTVDHLGTPVLLTDNAGTSLWSGGFEPFGKDFSNAQGAGEFLRFPGQWEDQAWEGSSRFYNVNRWYSASTGTYLEPDPIGLEGGVNNFAYAGAQPLLNTDPLGLMGRRPRVPGDAVYYVCCRNGQRTVCRGPAPLPSNPAIGDCEKEHESQHAQDFAAGTFRCSPCTKSTPNDDPIISPDKSPVECSGYCAELRCLKKKGKDPKVLKRIDYVVERTKQYCATIPADCQP